MLINKIVTAAIVVSIFSGCSFSGKVEDYQRSSTIKQIDFPPSVESIELPPLYPIPEARIREEAFYNVETDGFLVPRPEPMSAEREKSKIKIQKVGDRSWILVEAPTSQVWPLAQSFLMQYDMDSVRSNPASGLVETSWVEFKDDPAHRHQFRLRIEQGVRTDTTEIHVLERSRAATAKKPETWPSTSDEPERETWVLTELANSLAGSIGNRAASLLGQAVGGQVKAELFMDHDEPAMRLRLDMQRAWATVAQSVSKEGFMLWDEDSEADVLYVQHEMFLPKRFWLARWILGETEAQRTSPYKLNEILQHLSDQPPVHELFDHIDKAQFNDALADGYGCLVVLSREDGDVIVKVRDYAGRLLSLKENKKLLTIIRRNLI